MPRTPKNNPDDFVVSAYQNPYSGKLFAMDQKDEFLKELRATQRLLKEERQRAKLFQERKDLWIRIRTEVSSVNDIEMFCRAQCSQEMENLYLREQHRERLSSSDFWSLPVLKTRIEHFSISHDAPLGTPSNWGLRDETRVGHKIALRIESSRNLNYTMYEYSKSESGFRVDFQEMYLFADDWPFVQRMALGEFLEGNLKSTMSRHPINEFVADLERYSVLQTGMPLSQLKDLHAMGACTKETLMRIRPSEPPVLGLPDYIDSSSELRMV